MYILVSQYQEVNDKSETSQKMVNFTSKKTGCFGDFFRLLHLCRMARSREWGGEPELLMPLSDHPKRLDLWGRKVCSGKLTCVSPKNLEHHLPNEVVRFFCSHFFGFGYEWIWQPCINILELHARFLVYNLSPKMCDQSRKGASTMTFLCECSSLSTVGWPAVSGEAHISYHEHRLSTASYPTLKSSKCGKRLYINQKQTNAGETHQSLLWKCLGGSFDPFHL